MCHQIKIIAKNTNGELSICENCKIYHLTFNNIYIEFDFEEMLSFKNFVIGIEVDYWETKYNCMSMKRKIPIQTQQSNLVMIFNRQELTSLRDLLTQTTKKPYGNLSVVEIDYTLFLN